MYMYVPCKFPSVARKCASAHDRVTMAHYCAINHMFDNYTNINVGNIGRPIMVNSTSSALRPI